MVRLCSCCLLALVLSACDRPDVRFPQFIQDEIVVWALFSEIEARLEEGLAGQTAGETSFTTTCAGNGSMRVTGTLGADGGAELALELDHCGIEQTEPDERSACSLTITGPMTFTYVTDRGSGAWSEELQSDHLEIDGTVTSQGEEREVTDGCALSVTLKATDVSVALYGRVCGRDTTSSLAHASCGT